MRTEPNARAHLVKALDHLKKLADIGSHHTILHLIDTHVRCAINAIDRGAEWDREDAKRVDWVEQSEVTVKPSPLGWAAFNGTVAHHSDSWRGAVDGLREVMEGATEQRYSYAPPREEEIGDHVATIVDLRQQLHEMREQKARIIEGRTRDRELLAETNNRVHALKEENEKLSKILWNIAREAAVASLPIT